MKRILIVRYGAYGDSIILTPSLRELKRQGWYTILHTSERGLDILGHSKYVDEFIPYTTDSVPCSELAQHWDELRRRVPHDKFVNLTGSIEMSLVLNKDQAAYFHPQDVRGEMCDKNYYEETARLVGLDYLSMNHLPMIHAIGAQHELAKKHIKRNKFNILINTAGSSISRYYPWTVHLVPEILKRNKDANIIMVGDKKALMTEAAIDVPVTKLCDKVPFMTSALLTKYVDLVISVDSGVLHAAGCWDTPKIALLGNTTSNNITKHFKNCINIEADCECSPCFKTIFDIEECPSDKTTGACLCMGYGISPFEILNAIDVIRGKR